MTRNALRRAGLESIADLLPLSDTELLQFETLGPRGLAAIRALIGPPCRPQPAPGERPTGSRHPP
jgi:hypothetical protein